jgi:hypothetical protein
MSRVCWVPGCGRTDTTRFLNYWACPEHTPAKARERYGSPWPVWDGTEPAENDDSTKGEL